jgi:hypothetical protein
MGKEFVVKQERYAGMLCDQVRELEQLHDESARLENLVAELGHYKANLQDINAGGDDGADGHDQRGDFRCYDLSHDGWQDAGDHLL